MSAGEPFGHLIDLNLAASRAMKRALAAEDAGDLASSSRWHSEYTKRRQQAGAIADVLDDDRELELPDLPEEIRRKPSD